MIAPAVAPQPASSVVQVGTAVLQSLRSAKPMGTDGRGLVMSPPAKIGPEGLEVEDQLDLQELRSTLLFWDRIDYPSNNAFPGQTGPEEDFLIAEGVMSRSGIVVAGQSDAGLTQRHAHLLAYRLHEEQEPGRWTLGHSADALGFPPDEMAEGRGLLLKLYQAVPIPDRDMPLEAVLDFKHRRRDELIALRTHFERVYQAILGAPDRSLAELTEWAALDKAIADHVKVAIETKSPFKLANLQMRFKFGDVAIGYAAADMALRAHLPLASAVITGGLAAAASSFGSLGVGLGLKEAKASNSPFEYITSIHRDML
ncbi:hypothetical protein B7G68_08715 [Caulobacter segnis]|uniref:Uncharacterized protein n=1 Tax=Caulobacter segnis TaxID=88688 RepID=A0ABN5ITV5_9CAUL|nr:DUF6236 family protein [Caulobacter segnis]AVQ01920.1 hypothetical protein B7G68_08715 [Caulobacter segnis]